MDIKGFAVWAYYKDSAEDFDEEVPPPTHPSPGYLKPCKNQCNNRLLGLYPASSGFSRPGETTARRVLGLGKQNQKANTGKVLLTPNVIYSL